MIRIQMELYQNKKNFLYILFHIWNLAEILNILKKKADPLRFCVSKITDSENVVR